MTLDEYNEILAYLTELGIVTPDTTFEECERILEEYKSK